MKFKIGDKVKFLNDSEEGIIIAISEEGKIITVRTNDGFDIPVISSELVPVIVNVENKIKGVESDQREDIRGINKEDIQNRKENKESIEKKENLYEIISQNVDEKAKREILLGFVPVNSEDIRRSDIKMYLINDSDWDIGFVVSYQVYKKYTFIKRSWLPPHCKLLIKKWNQTDLSKVVSFNVQVLFMCNGEYIPLSPVNKNINISNIAFYKPASFSENKYFKTEAVIIPVNFSIDEEEKLKITPQEIAAAMMVKKDIKTEFKDLQKSLEIQREIDLHIDSLIDNYEGLTPAEIMQIQINHFHKEIDRAIRDGIERIIFIHGVGNGLLKHEIRKELEKKYPDLSYQDASFKEYGYGATMVFLK